MSDAVRVLDLSERINASLKVETPGPGVYPDASHADYHAWSAASNSRLSKLRRSPAHLKSYLDDPAQKDTQALTIGRAVHAAVLEPDDFDTRYTVAGQCTATKKGDGQRCSNNGIAYRTDAGWLCGVHAKGFAGVDNSRAVLNPADYSMCLRIRDSVHAHKGAKMLLSGEGRAELSMLWNDAESGVLCKARHDRHTPWLAGGAIVDLKTTRNASAREFERSIFSHGYFAQGAHYLNGAKAHDLPAEHFVIVAVEKEPPFAVGVYRLTEGALDAGAELLKPLLKLYHECVTTDHWPGYTDEVVDVALPDWSWSVLDTEIGAGV